MQTRKRRSSKENIDGDEGNVEGQTEWAQTEGVVIPVTDDRTIWQIARRAADIYHANGNKTADPAYIASEIAIVHDEIVRLRLKEMLNASAFDLMHDVAGIHKHLFIGRPSTLQHCFVPRFAAHQVSPDAA